MPRNLGAYLRAAGLGTALCIGLAQPAEAQSVFGRVHVENGLTWIDRGVPYTASAAVQIAFSLAPGATDTTTDMRPEQNLLVGPLAGVRFTNLPEPAHDWEAFGGAQVSGRLLRTAAPLDLVWALDAGISTRLSVVTGASGSVGLRQRWTLGLRAAYEWKHGDPILTAAIAVPLFAAGGERRRPCPSAFTRLRTRADSIAFQAFTLSRDVDTTTRLPDGPLPPSVTDVAKFQTLLRGTVPDDVLAPAFLERIVRRALRIGPNDPLPAGWDSRETAEAVLRGWRERIRMQRCLA